MTTDALKAPGRGRAEQYSKLQPKCAKSVPIQLAQCRFSGLAIADAKT